MSSRWIIGDAFRLENRDLNYYRDKYLVMICAFAMILAGDTLMRRPFPKDGFLHAALWLGIVALCLALSKRLGLVLAGALGFLSLRGWIAFFSSRDAAYFIFALVVGASAFGIVKLTAHKYRDLQLPKSYTGIELAIDVCIFMLILYGLIKLT